jgi:hypothetical protein
VCSELSVRRGYEGGGFFHSLLVPLLKIGRERERKRRGTSSTTSVCRETSSTSHTSLGGVVSIKIHHNCVCA